MNVVRFGVSVEQEVLEILDNYMRRNKLANRSQAIRQLVQKMEVEKQWDKNEMVGGSLTIVYDRRKRELLDKLAKIQHDYHKVILCSQHIHLNNNNCMEIIAMKGKAEILRELSGKILAVKGIVHGKFSTTKVE